MAVNVLMNLGFSQHILEKYSSIKFHENPLDIIKGQKLSSGSLTTQEKFLRQETKLHQLGHHFRQVRRVCICHDVKDGQTDG